MRLHDRHELHLNMAAQEVGEGRAVAAIGDVRELDACHPGKQLCREVGERAAAGRADVELARVLLGIGKQFRNRAGWDARVQRQRVEAGADASDRRKILARVEAGVGIDARADRRGPGRGGEERVAVGRALRDRPAAGEAAGARTVVDDDRLAKSLAHLVGNDARHDPRAAAGREWHDQGDGAVRIGLRRGCEDGGPCGECCCDRGEDRSPHAGILQSYLRSCVVDAGLRAAHGQAGLLSRIRRDKERRQIARRLSPHELVRYFLKNVEGQ